MWYNVQCTVQNTMLYSIYFCYTLFPQGAARPWSLFTMKPISVAKKPISTEITTLRRECRMTPNNSVLLLLYEVQMMICQPKL